MNQWFGKVKKGTSNPQVVRSNCTGDIKSSLVTYAGELCLRGMGAVSIGCDSCAAGIARRAQRARQRVRGVDLALE